ncbi:MobF family relaxase [Streptomyces violascens]|uniref:TrwC relaxase domain-containing protein n=1 Tax=Streptomyces violascens TaxID=67381 RepID=A0ABQ3QL68_9ACTN|nr:MobF family relaxase [Streptomyces violascens]GGU44706.1 hypothetical protein GCM10010289_76620 [Streptomyces violascens]GHI38032.1 hypothetical protein Sviol_24400 [Streptomyces violascens]
MAWVTRIVNEEQVEYRLSQHSGCYVQQDGEGLAQAPQQGSDRQVDYRMDSAGDSGLVWIGEGLPAVGLTPGTVLDEAGKEAARRLANGVDPRTGERLVEPELRAHPRARLVGAPLVEAIEKAAAAAGVEAAALFAGKPKQAAKYAALARMVHQKGERHRLQVDSLHRLARAAGVRLEDVYEAGELAQARAHQDERVNVRIRAYDVVADLPKSASVLWALLGPERETEWRALVHQAKREAFGELEQWIGYGLASEDGSLHRIATGGLLGWSMEHQSARPVDDDVLGDPHLHLHLMILNLARCEDGEWRAIANGGMDLHRHVRAFDALFKARVRALAAERFGVRYEQDAHTGAWEIVGIPVQLRTHFSRRAADVDAIAGAHASREEKLRVSAQTRHAKHDTGNLDLRADWRCQAEELGIDVEAMVAAAAPGPSGGAAAAFTGPGLPPVPPPDQIAAQVFDPQHGLTAHDKEFSRAQLLAAVANSCPYGLPAEDLGRLADRVLEVKGYAVPLPPRGAGLLSNAERFTTQDIVAAEQTIVDQARARYGDGTAQLSAEQAAAALSVFEVASGFTLGAEQRGAVQRLLTTGHGIDAIEGVAGAGKTSLMAACRIGWDAVGMTYAGTALSAVAAANLQEGSGIPARTLASWLERINSGAGLRGLDVLVIDEAVMTDDRALAILLTEAARTGTKVIGVGDPQQLQAIGPGGGWAEVHRIVGGARLTVNRRQQDQIEKAALEAWRTSPEGRERALQQLATGQRVHATDTPDQARAGVLEAWAERRTRWTDPHDVLDGLVVLAARNSDVAALNHGAQAIRRAAGELGTAHTYALPRGGKLTLAVGDLVRVRANDYRSRRGEGPDVLNGYRAVVTAMSDDHQVQITWRRTHPDGQKSFHQAWVTPGQITQGALSLGYAMTVTASQGLTVDVSLLYALGANAYSAYPGITRARLENHLWLPVAALEDEKTRKQFGQPASEAEALERALNAYAALLRQDRPSGMVLDQLRPAPEPMAAPADTVPAEELFARWDDRGARPYGALPASRLEAQAAQAERQADEAERLGAEQARTAREGAAALAARPSPGQQITAAAAAVLIQAEQLMAAAEHDFARAAEARAAAAEASQIRDQVAQTAGRGRLALRMAGTSRAEQEQLITHYTGQLTAAADQAQQAQNAAEQAQRRAAQLVAASPYAALLRDLAGPADPAAGPAGVRRQYASVRAQLPQIAERIDADQAAAVQQARTQSVQLGARASAARSTAEALRSEAQLRRQIAAQAPQQHAREAAARDAAVRTAATRPSAPSAQWPRPAGPAAVRGPGERRP